MEYQMSEINLQISMAEVGTPCDIPCDETQSLNLPEMNEYMSYM